MLKAYFSRAIQIYRSEGLGELARRSTGFCQRFVQNGFRITRYQTEKRVDAVDRWEMMQPYIDEDDSNLLDIGCANGWLTSKFHNEGLFCIGVDRAEQMLTMARSGNEFSDGLGYVRYNLTPESVSRIPSFDVILLLTVYHHWVQAYGNSAASDMLRHLGENSEKLFFELPEQELHDEVPCPESQPIKEYHLDYLNEVFGSDKAIEFIGRADYKGEERRDLLYIISSPRSSE